MTTIIKDKRMNKSKKGWVAYVCVLSSAGSLWKLTLSREISAVLYPALEKRHLTMSSVSVSVNNHASWLRIAHAESPPGVPNTHDNKDGTSGHNSC
jgi:hypothetical protein